MAKLEISEEEIAEMQSAIAQTEALTNQSSSEQARLIIQAAAPAAARSLVWLSLHANKESVRMQSSIHLLDRSLGRVQDTPPTPVEEPFQKLMEDCAREADDEYSQPSAMVEPPVDTSALDSMPDGLIAPGTLPKFDAVSHLFDDDEYE